MALLTTWRLMDIGIFLFFLLFFTPRWLGYLVALLFGYRLLKSFLPGGNSLAHRLVDCSQHHTHDDGHQHTGVRPKGHDHRDDGKHHEGKHPLFRKKPLP